MSAGQMLVIEVHRIPPEGLPVEAALDPAQVHVEGEESFNLLPGGTLRCLVERGEDDAVHVRGHLSAPVRLQCGRCLADFTLDVQQDLDLFYLPHDPNQDERDEQEDEVELSDREMVVAYYQGGRVDLGEMVREQIFLAVPLKRLCRESCAGLCPSCGKDLNAGACQCPPEDDVDPRLAALKGLLGRESS